MKLLCSFIKYAPNNKTRANNAKAYFFNLPQYCHHGLNDLRWRYKMMSNRLKMIIKAQIRIEKSKDSNILSGINSIKNVNNMSNAAI